ncbi:3-oxosteroid 1-dehydrogenase [Endozoicomonas montiporae]|uniref:3-oxosteroid 1-dehydrogenase n=2 Tax=Endozoicomonas montiporae TaxID=1027273 RepID=A0A081N823_9GAMM|nr:3-oxosteroid 1-dehydrogenase [Endozoicomonas montiporae]
MDNNNNKVWDKTVDVIVVGSGAGALTAALRSHDLGMRVLVVEKSDVYGGTSAISGGGIWIPDNHQISQLGGEDSEEKSISYLKNIIGHDPGDGRIEAFVGNAKKMLKYLENNTRVRYESQPAYADYYPEVEGGLPGYRSMDPLPFDARELGDEFEKLRPTTKATLMLGRMSMDMKQARVMLTRSPGFLPTTLKVMWRYWSDLPWRFKSSRDRLLMLGNALVGALRASMMDRNIPLWLSSPMKNLITENDTVIGIEVEKDGKTLRLKAQKGVILATGGFEQNQAMREQYLPQPSHTSWSGTPAGQNTGDGITAGMALGAEVAYMEHAWWAPSTLPPGEVQSQILFVERALPGSMMVNSAGKRFCNEAAPYNDIGYDMYRADQEEGVTAAPCWFVFDARFRNRYPCGPLLPGYAAPDSRLPDHLKKDDYYFRENTLEALAEKIGVDKEGLLNTVREYNANAQKGIDPEFNKGKSLFDRYYGDPTSPSSPCNAPLEKGPFYAIKVNAGDIGTKGGLRTDVHARVLDRQGQAIPGLYATGNTSASPMVQTYPGAGATLGPAMTFGYLAANHIKNDMQLAQANVSVQQNNKKESQNAVEV